MDDMRQKLFPIFLKEAEKNLAALRQFLSYESLAIATAEELETAFRAAHTLKGTAALVQAESICKISRRVEAMLEKHYSAHSVPTPVEHEALKLAVDWLAPLVSALQGNLQEPTLFVTEALQALDLAEAFPGRTPLVELLDSCAAQRAPHLDDPFAGDPELLLGEDEIVAGSRDPFAEDPAFGVEIDLVTQLSHTREAHIAEALENVDPFADDDDFLTAAVTSELAVEEAEGESASVIEPAPLPFDPFADDLLGLEIDGELDEVAAANPRFAVDDSTAEILAPLEFEEELIEAESPPADFVVDSDPFAEDEDFIDSFATEAENAPLENSFACSPEMVALQAETIAESLLLPDREAAPRKDYVCCVFTIGERNYYLPISQMQEIADLPQLLPLPLAPPMVSGLVNLRGQVLPVINLAILNQHQQADVRVQRRLVVALYKGESLAFLADGVPYLSEAFSGEKIDMAEFLSLYQVRGFEL